jgi:hypothetical protein
MSNKRGNLFSWKMASAKERPRTIGRKVKTKGH